MPHALPDIREQQVVLFHKDLRLPSYWIVLQIPLKGKQNKSNTYRIDLQNRDDRAWLQRLPLERQIKDLLGLYGHVIYYPKVGEAIPVEDHQVTDATLFEQFFAGAQPPVRGRQNRWDRVKLGVRRVRRAFPFVR